jgi:hypothetical protein
MFQFLQTFVVGASQNCRIVLAASTSQLRYLLKMGPVDVEGQQMAVLLQRNQS